MVRFVLRTYLKPVIFSFGPFELDAAGGKLRREGEEVPLQPKVFDVIRYLAEHHDRVVPKEELLGAIWPGEHVSDTAVPWTISRARRALGQGPDDKHPIETVHRRGYRLASEVRQIENDDAGPLSSTCLTAPPDSAASPASRDPFVGRAEPMDRLIGALQGVHAGRGRLCLLTGDAGIGKSRCIGEFSSIVRRLKVSLWMGRCLEGGRTAAFWPWVQVLRDAIAEDALAPELKVELGALLAELVPQSDAPQVPVEVEESNGLGARFWLLERLSSLLSRCAETGPRVILFEDMHWADDASLDLLSFLAPDLSHMSVLIVATARDAPASASEAWGKIRPRLGPCDRIELSGLKPEDVEAYVTEVTGVTFPPEIHRTIYAKCGGHPLFLQESVRLLTDCCDKGGSDAVRTDDITVPGVARDVLRGRLAGLSLETFEALELACVIGQEFELPVLQSSLGVGAEPLLLRLDDATRARLIVPRPRAGTYAFVHDTIREALYEELSPARRADLHRRVAEASEARSAADFRINDVAYHYHRGLPCADAARVERHARRAGESAMARLAFEDACQFFGWAIEAQRAREGVDARSRSELLLALSTALLLSGQLVESRKVSERVIAIARESGLADVLWETARSLRPTVRSALVPDQLALGAFEDASKLLTDDDSSLRIRVLAQLACIPPYSLSMERSDELSTRAVELARQSGNAEDLAQALTSRLHVLSGPDQIDDVFEVTDEILRLDPSSAIEVEGVRYCALVQRGNMAAADAVLENCGRLARASRRPTAVWHYERRRALRCLYAGRFDEADALFHELFVQGRDLRLPYAERYYVMHSAALAYERTGFQAMPIAGFETELEWASTLPSFRAHWALLLVETGRRDEARHALDIAAQNGFANVTKDIGYLNALAHLSVVAVSLEDRARARSLYALLRPYPHHNTPNGFNFQLGSVSFFLGVLARFLGRAKDAASHLEEALTMNERMGCIPQVARTQAALGDLLVDGLRRADRARAQALLSEAAATARRLQMEPLTAQVERSQSRLEAATTNRVASSD